MSRQNASEKNYQHENPGYKNFTLFYYKFDTSQVKQNLISSIKNLV